MANRNETEILTDFDNNIVNMVTPAYPHTFQTIRDRLELEVLLDIRAYLKDCKQLLQDIKAKL